jgi:hypothetical protein
LIPIEEQLFYQLFCLVSHKISLKGKIFDGFEKF